MPVQPGQGHLAPALGVDLADEVPVPLDDIRDRHARRLEVAPEVVERQRHLLDRVGRHVPVGRAAALARDRKPPTVGAGDLDMVAVRPDGRVDAVRVARGFHALIVGRREWSSGSYVRSTLPLRNSRRALNLSGRVRPAELARDLPEPMRTGLTMILSSSRSPSSRRLVVSTELPRTSCFFSDRRPLRSLTRVVLLHAGSGRERVRETTI